MEQEIKIVMINCAEFLIRQGEHIIRFELEKHSEIKKELDNIKRFLESEYKLNDKKHIRRYKYHKDKLFIGDTYILTNQDYDLKGKFCIVFTNDIDPEPFYIFRTEIQHGEWGDWKPYRIFVSELNILFKELKNRSQIKIDTSSQDSEPGFYKKEEKVDIDSFKKFHEEMKIIADKYSLYYREKMETLYK